MLRKTLTILSLIGLVVSVVGFGLVLLIAITGLQWNPRIGEDYLALWGSSTRVNVGYCDVVQRLKLAGDDNTALLMLDREMSNRAAAAETAA